MSDGKIDETITATTNENGDKEDETLKTLSDGEIDDDEPEEKVPIIDLPRKNLKNFRARHDNSDSDGPGSDGGADKTKGITDGELRKLKNRMNGEQMLDKNVLENYRDKIINELGRKNDHVKERKEPDRGFFYPKSRFNPNHNGFRGNRDRNRGNDRKNFNRMSFADRNRNNRQRENGMNRHATADELRVVGIKRALYFPLSTVKHTKNKPSISYSERPQPKTNKIRDKSTSKTPAAKKSDESKKEKDDKKSPQKKSAESSKSSHSSPKKTPTKVQEPVKERDHDKIPKDSDKEKQKSPIEKSSEDLKTPVEVPEDDQIAKSPENEKLPEKIKVELKLEKKKSPRRIEKPKVNIFLEDSDEVDEFESAIVEVRSKWSSPVRIPDEEKIPKMVSPPILPKFTNIPLAVESPEKSPLLPLTDNIYDLPSSVPIEKSPTPSPPPKPTKVRNVCSFLSDIASGNMFAGLGLGSGLYDDPSSDGLNLDATKSEAKSRVEVEAMEPDTTVIKSNFVGSITPSDNSDSSDESESESSSDSDDTTSESDESSDESSDDDIPTFSGFGRFDASSMPMVTQIKSATALDASTPTPSRFQPHQSVIKPPELVTNVVKPPFYTPQSASATPMPFTVGLGTMSFPIPFKIYSLRDATNCQIMFPSPVQPAVQTITTPASDKKDQEKEKDRKDSEKDKKDLERKERDRKRSRSRSRSHDKERKRLKDDRRKTPPRNRARTTEDRKDFRRKDPSPRHNSHSSRSSHTSRQSPTRRPKRSRSRTPPRHRQSPRPRTPPRQKSPPLKARRSSPLRRSLSRSPKHRRSLSPVSRRMRSQSPLSRRSPRRRSRSPRNRRGSSPDYRYERRSISPSFNKTDSPLGYRMDQIRPDSTISDTELERQQQFMQEEFYTSQWNNLQPSSSPKRPNLDDRIHRMLSDSPSRAVQHDYPPDAYPYPYHDNRNGMFYQDMYPPGHHQMSQHDGYDYHSEFSSPRNFVNNSNLVDITQQSRDRQRAGNSQAVQVGNVLEIVPNNKIMHLPEASKDLPNKSKALSPSEMKQQAEKRVQAKLKRKINRERKRAEKQSRKEKLRLEIQRYFDAGVTVDLSDDENLIPLRVINITATVEKSILRRSKALSNPSNREKKVLFSDGILPGETTSDDETNEGVVESLAMKRRRKKYRKTRLVKAVKASDVSEAKESETVTNNIEIDGLPSPPPPTDKPPAHLKQPQLKKITVEMFAAFPVNPDPLYYYIHKIQQAKSMYQAQQPPRPNDRFHYYKTQPPVVNQSPSYPQPPRSLNNSVSSLDPRIRSAEKSFT